MRPSTSSISYVRIRSIFRKGEIAESEFRIPNSEFPLTDPSEFTLTKKLLHFGEVLPQVLDDYRPNLLANYLYELASTFHSFFEQCPVLKGEGETLQPASCYAILTARILASGLDLLGIEVPERM